MSIFVHKYFNKSTWCSLYKIFRMTRDQHDILCTVYNLSFLKYKQKICYVCILFLINFLKWGSKINGIYYNNSSNNIVKSLMTASWDIGTEVGLWEARGEEFQNPPTPQYFTNSHFHTHSYTSRHQQSQNVVYVTNEQRKCQIVWS